MSTLAFTKKKKTEMPDDTRGCHIVADDPERRWLSRASVETTADEADATPNEPTVDVGADAFLYGTAVHSRSKNNNKRVMCAMADGKFYSASGHCAYEHYHC